MRTKALALFYFTVVTALTTSDLVVSASDVTLMSALSDAFAGALRAAVTTRRNVWLAPAARLLIV